MSENGYETLRFYKESDISSPIHKLNPKQIIEIMKKMDTSFPILYMEKNDKCPEIFVRDHLDTLLELSDGRTIVAVKLKTKHDSQMRHALRIYQTSNP